jgi:type I site-specific restriction endonuclease
LSAFVIPCSGFLVFGWEDVGLVDPDEVDGEAVNRWLFNTDKIDKALEYLMTHGHKVAGGDRLAKTIVSAANQKHANFITKASMRTTRYTKVSSLESSRTLLSTATA